MGANQWRDEDDWPLASALETKYFLHSGGKANSAAGDGALTATPPRSEQADQYNSIRRMPFLPSAAHSVATHRILVRVRETKR